MVLAVKLCLALDIGGTKLAAGLVDEDGGLRHVRRRQTPKTRDAEAVFSSLSDLLDEVLDWLSSRAEHGGPPGSSGFEVVVGGVGCGGPMSRSGRTVSPLNIPAWRDFPLRARLEELTALDVHVDNDAKALALGEGWTGAARGENHYIAMVVSTGIGGGIVLDGRLLEGEDSNAGHIGHVIVEPDGRTCACGAQGCLEAEASGTAIFEMTGRPPPEAEEAVIVRSGTLVGRGVASVANLLDLRLAVVGGSVALGYGDRFFEAAQKEIRRRSRLSFSKCTRIVPAALGEDAPVIGAGAVGWRALGHRLH